MDFYFTRHRHPHGPAVGITPRRTDVIRRLRRQSTDTSHGRLGKAYDQNVAGEARGGVDVIPDSENEPGIAAADVHRDVTFRWFGHRRRHDSKRYGENGEAERKRPWNGATARHT